MCLRRKKKHRMLVPISGGISVMTSLVLLGAVTIIKLFTIFRNLFETESTKTFILESRYSNRIIIWNNRLNCCAVSFFDDVLELPVWFRFMTLILCSGIVIGVSDLSITSLGNL